jgi:predicted alpha-1,2-mannosidase
MYMFLCKLAKQCFYFLSIFVYILYQMKKFVAILFFTFIHNLFFAQQLTKFVDPFLGTGGHGHVYPGATVPFGMVQLSPDNGVEGWDWCAGYNYSSNTIAGFSHTHLSGTGIGDWCDISVMPLNNDDSVKIDKAKFAFNHKNETAKPGYYQVKLDNGINCELTTTDRVGYHRYNFPTNEGYIQFDMGFTINWDKTTDAMLQLYEEDIVVGYRYSTGWAKGQKVYFAAKLNTPIHDYIVVNDTFKNGTIAYGKKLKGLIKFESVKPIEMQVAISSVSVEQALQELNTNGNKKFNQVVQNANTSWEQELQKIKINTNDKAFATKFYTALYRTCLAPVIHSDADGSYQTHDNKIKNCGAGKNKYTIFSQWDVFRALSPLFTITQPKRLPDMINSMLQLYDDNGLLPVWDISTWEANTMTGYHSVPIIADAMLKEIKGFDYKKAYEAMLKSANQNQRGTQDFIKYGYVPQSKHGWSVTITLEYAFDDWCIAQVAKKLGKTNDYTTFMKRAMSYKNLFDASTGFMRSKDTVGAFIQPFDPLLSEHGFDGQYIEGTAWQHSFFVPQDVEGLAKLFGGKEKLVIKLDSLFTAPSILHGDNTSIDVTGLIGQYAHGNEPSHHIIYMYSALGQPAKAAHWIKVVTDSMYKTGPEGLVGNDDCGQMSAWYIWTALGMYPMNPVSGEYVFGNPLINNATIQLPNNKKLNVTVKRNNNYKDEGISTITLNGKVINNYKILHTEIQKGGNLQYTLHH